MAPPTKKPRLHELDPEELGKTAVEYVHEFIATLVKEVGGTYKPSSETPKLERQVIELTKYAQKGTHLSNIEDFDRVWWDVNEALYACAAMPGGSLDADGLSVMCHRESKFAIVMSAAHARTRLAHYKAGVSFMELAALAGLSYRQVWKLAVEDRVLRSEHGIVPPADAKRWLAAREVPGF